MTLRVTLGFLRDEPIREGSCSQNKSYIYIYMCVIYLHHTIIISTTTTTTTTI